MAPAYIISNVVVEGMSFSGTWRETIRQADGTVTGRTPGKLQASFDGTGFGIQLEATTNGGQQAVTIQADGTNVKTVSGRVEKNRFA